MSDKERFALAEKLRLAREYLGLSQDEVALYLKISRSAISLIESGQRKIEFLELKQLAKLYERPVSYFADEKQIAQKAQTKDVRILERAAEGLKPKDLDEILKFAEFLKSRANRGRDDE